MEPGEIDPVKYGVLWERVQQMDKKIDKMETQIAELLELANKSKGGLWAGMAVVSAFSAFVSWVVAHMKG
jgi:hypothetical protein